MPYVEGRIRDALDPSIVSLHKKMVSLLHGWGTTNGVESAGWGYMRYVALKVLEETGLNAAEQYQGKRGIRYWLVVDYDGIPVNIALELIDRVYGIICDRQDPWVSVDISVMPMRHAFPDDASNIDLEINALVAEISRLGGPKPEGYDYDGAYNGLVNYSMTELMPRVLKSVRDACDKKFSDRDVELLIRFWFDIAREIYNPGPARRYEDEQAKKNRDVKVYNDMRAWLEK